MRWFNRLFWKIFFATWLSILLMLGGALLLISQSNERTRINDWLLDSVQLNAEQLVEEYERTQGLSKRRLRYYRQRFERGFHKRLERLYGSSREHHDSDQARQDSNRLMPRIRVYDEARSRRIFGQKPRPERELAPTTLRFQSESGQTYRVEVALPERRHPFSTLFRAALSYQIIIVLLGSGLASVLLTWLIVRPINQLRLHTRELHQGNLGTRAGQQLSQRRDELGELAREFNSMADYVEQTLVGGQRLLQDVSHELRAPLARLQVAAGLAEQKLGTGDRLTERINLECDQLNRLIDEILSLSRLDAQPLDSEPYPLAELLQVLYDDIHFSAPQRVLHWPEPAVCVEMPGNRALLHRALSNVLTNALRHTPADAEISLTIEQAMTGLTIVVRDTGPGVDEALLGHLLEPFVRAEGKKAEGYGLGLSIARRALERLKGEIRLRNHPAGGLEVRLTVPR